MTNSRSGFKLALFTGIAVLLMLDARSESAGLPIRPKYLPTSSSVRWQPVSAKARHKIEVAEKELVGRTPGPPAHGQTFEAPCGGYNFDVEEVLQESLAAESSGRAYSVLGKLYLRFYDYEKAIRNLSLALRSKPSAQIKSDMQRATSVFRLQKIASAQLPKSKAVHRFIEFLIKGHRLWALLAADKPKTDDDQPENAGIWVFEEHSSNLTLRWKSNTIPSVDHRQFHDIDIWPYRLTGQKTPDLVYIGVTPGGSATPTNLRAYRWTGSSFREILSGETQEGTVLIKDLNHDGRMEVLFVNAIHARLAHSEQPRWSNIYEWNGACYELSNAKHPNEFRQAVREIRGWLKKNPDDPELLKHLALWYGYVGMKSRSAETYRKMESAYLWTVKQEPNDTESWVALGEYASMMGRTAKAVQYFQQAKLTLLYYAGEADTPEDKAFQLVLAKEMQDRIDQVIHARK